MRQSARKCCLSPAFERAAVAEAAAEAAARVAAAAAAVASDALSGEAGAADDAPREEHAGAALTAEELAREAKLREEGPVLAATAPESAAAEHRSESGVRARQPGSCHSEDGGPELQEAPANANEWPAAHREESKEAVLDDTISERLQPEDAAAAAAHALLERMRLRALAKGERDPGVSPPTRRGAPPGLSPLLGSKLPRSASASPSPPYRSGRRVRFNLTACTTHEVTPYSEVYGVHPREFVFDRHFYMVPAGGTFGFVGLPNAKNAVETEDRSNSECSQEPQEERSHQEEDEEEDEDEDDTEDEDDDNDDDEA